MNRKVVIDHMERVVNQDSKLLYCFELSEGVCLERIAYLVRVVRRIDRNGYPYLVFYLRTADKVVLTGRRFRVNEDGEIGLNMLILNRSAVRVHFEVQIYNGMYSLLVKEIALLPNEDTLPFFDCFQKSEEAFQELWEAAKKLNLPAVNSAFKTASIFSLHNGLSGAYIELIASVYQMLNGKFSEHTNSLLVCFFNVVNPYFSYLLLMEKLEFLPKREILSILQSVVVEGDDRLTSVVSDVLSSLMGQGKPEHLYSHIIYNAFITAKSQMYLEEMACKSPKNLVIHLEDGTLIYY